MKSFQIKPGYKIRPKNQPFPDIQPTGLVYQPHVYELAIELARRGGKEYIIDIGAGNGEKLSEICNEFKVIAMDCDTNIDILRKNLPDAHQIIECDLEKGIPVLPDDVLKNAVVMSIDVIEHIVNPHRYLKDMSKISKIAPFVLISTPDRTRARGAEHFGPPGNPFHVREWAIDELHLVLTDYGIENFIGHTISNNEENYKGTSLAISGREAIWKEWEYKKALAIVTAYNEEDIIEQSIMHLLGQGLDVHVIDNWSTDKTANIVKSISKNNKRVTFEHFPAKKPKKHVYAWAELLHRVEAIAKTKKEYDWFVHNDADELRESAWRDKSLIQGISFADHYGYSAIDFTVIDFRPVKDGFSSKDNPNDFFHNFEFTGIPGYFQQIKCWKRLDNVDVDLASSGGHNASFEGQKVFPLKFLSKHYPLRSTAQANKKIFKERKNDFDKNERKKGWHIQYDNYTSEQPFIWDKKYLDIFTFGHFYNEYIVERLSGMGVDRDNK